MCEILKNHALKNIWAEAIQDRQYIIRPNRQTRLLGASCVAGVMWEGIETPTAGLNNQKTYHVWSLGQLPAWIFAIKIPKRTWVRCDQIGRENLTIVDIYLDNGGIIPRPDCWLYQNYDGNFILAIERVKTDYGSTVKESPYGEHITIPVTLDNTSITVRFYTNAVIQSEQWREDASNAQVVLRDVSKYISTQADYFAFMKECEDIELEYSNHGKIVYYVEGFMVSKPNGWDKKYQGKRLFARFDETIESVLTFPVNELPGFKSILDKRKDKYLIFPRSKKEDIDFFDDQDFYLANINSNGEMKAVYIDRLKPSYIRQVGNTAWSIRADLVHRLTPKHDFLSSMDANHIVVVRRKAGMNHLLGYQNDRLEDLYRLSHEEMLEALTQTESSVEFWKVANLENSSYTKLMSAKMKDITCDIVEDSYGYNAATKAVHRTLYKIKDKRVLLDPGLCISTGKFKPKDDRKNPRVFFWYDAERKLVGYTESDANDQLIFTPPQYEHLDIAYVEVMLGKAAEEHEFDGSYRDEHEIVDEHYGYYGHRHYVCEIGTEGLDPEWHDVTDGNFVVFEPATETSPPKYIWSAEKLEQANYFPVTRIASHIGIREMMLDSADPASFTFNLFTTNRHGVNEISGLFAQVDVFMDGKQLIHGLDYFYNAGNLTIVKQCENETADIFIRYYGYGNPETRRVFGPRDVGFVKNGRLSNNDIYNPVKDRPTKVIANGLLYLPEEVRFAEHTAEGNLFDGTAYAVVDYQPLVEPYLNKKTVDFQMEGIKRDQQVSEYLSTRLKEPEPINEYIEGEMWFLFSPLMAELISLMSFNMIDDAALDYWEDEKVMSEELAEMLDKYRDIDPAITGFNEQYVAVQPLPYNQSRFTVTPKQYAALERINAFYLNSRVDLTHHLDIQE